MDAAEGMRATWPFGKARPLSYRMILADPPWRFTLRSPKGETKSPQSHYSCMSLEDLKRLPVADLAAPDCLLFMWATAPMLPQALETLKAWHFRYVTMGAWKKTTSTGKAAFGTGYVLRSTVEPFLIGAIGRPRYASRSERNLIEAERREHSRKPDEQYEILERLCPDGPRIELFARAEREGWTAWGNQTSMFSPNPGKENPPDNDC